MENVPLGNTEEISPNNRISQDAENVNISSDVLQNQSESATIKENPATENSDVKNDVPTSNESYTVAYTNDNHKIDLKFKVGSVDDLIVSNDLDGKVNPDYPQELQPRDRSRVSSRSQILQMANNLNPARLAESTSVSEGAPIVGPDNVVESGNGRTLAINLAYLNGTADEYRNHIISNADKYGVDVSNLPERPVLVRERMTEVDRVEFTRKANESSIGSLSATEQARVDAEKLTGDILNLLVANDNGTINTSANKDFISAVITKVFKSEDLNNVVNADGMLSARGLERIKNAIFYKAYGDASLSARLSESLDNDMKNATNVLLNIAPKVVYVKNGIASGNLYDFDFSEDIASAVRLFEKCRNENSTVNEYASQTTMFEKETQIVMAMAYVFETKNRGAKQATDFYNKVLDTVIGLGDKKQLSLVDIREMYQTKEDVFNAAYKGYNNGVESKNTIAIPKSIYRPESITRGDDDGRGIYEVFGNDTTVSKESGNAVGVQQDNRRGKETGTVANDEQLRQKNESIEGQSEVKGDNSNEQTRSYSLSKNSRRGHNGGARKQTERISYFERKNQGRNATERQSFARELIKRGQAEEITQKIGKNVYKYNLVNPESYNDDMLAMVEEAKKKGVEIGFFIGNAKVNFDSKDAFLITGIKISDSQILVQYDENLSPQKIFKHELIHAKWKTRTIQAIKNTILNNLSEAEKSTILSQERMQRYQTIYKNKKGEPLMDIVWEEFVCDVMSGMSDYTANFIDTAYDYWYGNESIDSYSPAEYTTSTDAGGRYNLSNDSNNKRSSYPEWTEDVLDDFEFGKLETALLDIESGANANYYNRSASGEYIIQTDNKLIYTNGSHSNPKISKIIEFNSEYETEIDEMRRRIYNAEKGKSSFDMENRIIEGIYGQGCISTYNSSNGRPYGGTSGLREGIDGEGTSRNSSKKQRRSRYVEEIRGASKQGLKAIQRTSRKLKKSGIRYNIADVDSNGNTFADDGSTSTNSIDTGDNDVVLDVIGLGDEYRLSESGELNENTNAIGMEERGTYQNNDSVWQRSEDKVTETPEGKKITVGMSDDTRAELLSKKSINVVSFDVEKAKALGDMDFDALQKTLTRHAKPIIEKVAKDFGILNKTYFNPDIELDFEYSRGSLKESVNKQHTMYGDFVKMLSVFPDVIKNAVGIETHKDKYVGTVREDASLKQMYVLASALSDETGIIPVKLEVKEFNDKANKLYLSVVLTKKESRYPHGNLEQSPLNTATPASTISIADLVGIVNPSEGDFLKYFPDKMLDSEQIESKNKALTKDAEKVEKLKKSGVRYSITDIDSDGNAFADDGSTSTNSIDTGDNDVVLDVIGLGDEYRLSESGELNENTNAIGMEERGTYQNNDSVWQRSNDSEGLYRSVGNGKSMLRRSEEKGLGFIDWSRKFGNLNVNDPKEKGRAYGILRKISELKIADKDSLGRKLPKAIKEHFGQTVLKNSKGELVALYHATDEKFDIFKYGDFGFHIGNWEQATHLNKKFIKEVYVDVRNPMYIPVDSMHWYGIVIASRALSQDIINRNEYDSISKLDGFFGMDYNSDANIALRELLKEKGYDGIIYNNGFEEKGISVIAFDSNQIKYTSNRNPSANDDARYSLATDGILDLEDLWEDAKARYGTIPKGEKPVRDVDVPKKISEKDVVSQHARTMIEAGVTPDWAVSEFEQRILDGTMTHEVLTNKKASTWARQQIEHLGFEEALNRWSVWSDSGIRLFHKKPRDLVDSLGYSFFDNLFIL